MEKYNDFLKSRHRTSAFKKSRDDLEFKKAFFSFDNKIGIGVIWVIVISFLILQDYYVGTQIFKLETGCLTENFLFRLQNINFIIIISLVPFALVGMIFFCANLVNLIETVAREVYEDKKLTNLSIFKSIVIFSIVIMPFYFYIIDFLKLEFIESNPFLILFTFTLYYSTAFGLYNSFQPIKYSFRIAILYLFVLFIYAVVKNDLSIAFSLVLMIILYFMSKHIHTKQEHKTKNTLSKNKKNILFLILLIVVFGGITHINFSVWTQEKLKASPSIGILNKEFLVKNLTKIQIDDGFELMDNNQTCISAFDENVTVYYLPISLDMRWYFVDNKPKSQNSKITIYGVEEKVLDKNITHRLIFKTSYDVSSTKIGN